MKPRIDGTRFGSIIYGTSHTISLQEAKYVYERATGADCLIVGSGQFGNVELSPEATAYVKRRR